MQAVRQTVVAAQVAGAVVALDVKAGDTVKAGQVLSRLDARAAEQTAAASEAQVQSARATLEAATGSSSASTAVREELHQQGRARARRGAVQGDAGAGGRATGARPARRATQSGFFVVRAPYAGVVADVPVVLGDMAMPGRALLTLYDPAACASAPQCRRRGCQD